jgi:pimeloyl-ACP methyl ester carboxylesterase
VDRRRHVAGTARPRNRLDRVTGELGLEGQDYRLVAINAENVPTDADRIRKAYPQFEVKLMAGVGHFNMMEDPATFDRLVDETVRGFAAH